MADTLCGPSNPLQSFQKHTSTDRTLQQDRLTARRSPAEGFRSAPGPNAGILDREFEAFQAGLPPAAFDQFPLQPQPHELRHHHVPRPSFQANPGLADWASDFQQLHISPQSSAATSPLKQAQQQVSGHSQWFREFQTQYQQPESQQHQFEQSHFQPRFGGGSYGIPIQQPYGLVPSQDVHSSTEARWKGKGRWSAEESAQDTAAFEREFEAYASAELSKDGEAKIETSKFNDSAAKTQEEQVIDTEAEIDMSAQSLDEPFTQQYTAHKEFQRDAEFIERMIREHPAQADTNQTEKQATQESEQQSKTENNDLAKVAGELLESVSTEESSKFKNSDFMSLMRKLRDHEVLVEGDKMVEVNPEPTGQIPAALQDLDLGRNDVGHEALHPSIPSSNNGVDASMSGALKPHAEEQLNLSAPIQGESEGMPRVFYGQRLGSHFVSNDVDSRFGHSEPKQDFILRRPQSTSTLVKHPRPLYDSGEFGGHMVDDF